MCASLGVWRILWGGRDRLERLQQTLASAAGAATGIDPGLRPWVRDAAAPGTLLQRARELARIAGRLGEARAGEGGLTVIEGSAGIGKTSLLRAVRCAGRASGMRVLSGRGSELEQVSS